MLYKANTYTQDDDLLRELKQSKQLAFNKIYDRYWKYMYQSCNKVLKDRDASLDVVQDIFIKLWEKRESIEIHTNLKGYLLTAVKFRVANYIRHSKVKENFFEKVNQNPASYSTYCVKLEEKELQSYIRMFTNDLPEKCREIFVLSRNENLSNKEISSQLGISVKTVENQITIALKKLKANLAKMSLFSFLLFFLKIIFFSLGDTIS